MLNMTLLVFHELKINFNGFTPRGQILYLIAVINVMLLKKYYSLKM